MNTIALGSSFYNIETLHLTELARRFDRMHVNQTVVDLHVGYITLALMLNNYAFADSVCM